MTEPPTVVTDWRTRDESKLPDVAPGEEYERVIATQKFVVLHQVVVRGVVLVRLGIDAVSEVPFELDSVDGELRRYRIAGLTDDAVRKSLVKVGAAAAGENAVAIAPGLEVKLLVRNEGSLPVKPRAAIVVQEES